MSVNEITLNRVTKRYGKQVVLSGVSLKFPSSKATVVRGPSGCGKTTLLRCAALLETIDDGLIEVSVNDSRYALKAQCEPRVPPNVRRMISMVFQSLYLWNHLTVFENVHLSKYGFPKARSEEEHESVQNILAQLKIDELLERYPSQVSAGQRRRVALARAMVNSPSLLLLDEITVSLDTESKNRVYSVIEKIYDSGTGLVVATHEENLPHFLRARTIDYNNGIWAESDYV